MPPWWKTGKDLGFDPQALTDEELANKQRAAGDIVDQHKDIDDPVGAFYTDVCNTCGLERERRRQALIDSAPAMLGLLKEAVDGLPPSAPLRGRIKQLVEDICGQVEPKPPLKYVTAHEFTVDVVQRAKAKNWRIKELDAVNGRVSLYAEGPAFFDFRADIFLRVDPTGVIGGSHSGDTGFLDELLAEYKHWRVQWPRGKLMPGEW